VKHAVAVALALFLCSTARAQSEDEARAHYTLGASAYGRGDFETAVREFNAAWELSRRPEILFNLARAEVKLGRDRDAIAHLKEYLRLRPNADDEPAVRGEIAARERALQQQEESARQAAQAQAAAAEANAAARRAQEREAAAREQARLAAEAARTSAEAARTAERANRAPLRKAGIGLLAGGAGVVVVGIALGGIAAWESGQVKSGAGGKPVAFGGSAFAADESTGKLSQTLGIVFDVVGGVAAASGVGLLVWTSRASKARARLTPTPGGALVAGSF
jgi:tetratricopeptide (TPR) repeat protein